MVQAADLGNRDYFSFGGRLDASRQWSVSVNRMKDYYDLLVVFRLYDPDSRTLAKAIAATFRRRGTAVPEGVPMGLSEEFSRDPIAHRRWPEFLRRLRIEDAPEDLGDVVKTIWARVESAMLKVRSLTRGK